MQNINVMPTVSNIVNQWFAQAVDSANTVLPRSIFSKSSQVREEAVARQDVEQAVDSVVLQIDAEPVITLRGMLNESNYLALIDHARSLYTQGYSQITLDLSHCTNVKLSGLFALFSIHALFRGDMPLDSENGWYSLRQLADQHQQSGISKSVLCKNAVPKVADILMKNGLLSCP